MFDLLEDMLEFNPSNRIDVKGALEHSFICNPEHPEAAPSILQSTIFMFKKYGTDSIASPKKKVSISGVSQELFSDSEIKSDEVNESEANDISEDNNKPLLQFPVRKAHNERKSRFFLSPKPSQVSISNQQANGDFLNIDRFISPEASILDNSIKSSVRKYQSVDSSRSDFDLPRVPSDDDLGSVGMMINSITNMQRDKHLISSICHSDEYFDGISTKQKDTGPSG